MRILSPSRRRAFSEAESESVLMFLSPIVDRLLVVKSVGELSEREFGMALQPQISAHNPGKVALPRDRIGLSLPTFFRELYF